MLQRGEGGVEVRPYESQQCDLEHDARFHCVAHRHEGLAHRLKTASCRGRPEAGHETGIGRRGASHMDEKHVAEHLDEVSGKLAGIAATLHCAIYSQQHRSGVTCAYRIRELAGVEGIIHAAGRRRLVECGERIARGPVATTRDRLEGFVGKVELGVVGNLADEFEKCRVREEPKLERLRTTSNGRQDLLRIRGGKHEHHVIGWFFQRFQQGVRCCRREHVNLVDDVHLASARGSQRRSRDQLAHRVDPVVRRRVELDHVHRRTRRDEEARLTFATRFAVLQVRAVQRLCKDAGARGLSAAARTGEQVRMSHAVVNYRVSQRGTHVVLPGDVGETLRAVPAIERLIVHDDDATGAL